MVDALTLGSKLIFQRGMRHMMLQVSISDVATRAPDCNWLQIPTLGDAEELIDVVGKFPAVAVKSGHGNSSEHRRFGGYQCLPYCGREIGAGRYN